jgi:hypothetical protein
VAAAGNRLFAAETYQGVNACSVSADWSPKCGEFFGEMSIAQIDPTNGAVMRRIVEPTLGGMQYWIGLAVSAKTVALLSLGSMAVVKL